MSSVYTLEMRDCGGSDETVTISASTMEEARRQVRSRCEKWAKGGDWGPDGASIEIGWTLALEGAEDQLDTLNEAIDKFTDAAAGGDWGISIDDVESGEIDAEVPEIWRAAALALHALWIECSAAADEESGCVTVEIDPDHESLIDAACRHVREGCGNDPEDHDWTSDGEGGCDQNPGVWSTGGTSMSFASHCRCCGLHRSEHTTGSQRNPGEHDTVSYEMPETWCAECEREKCRYPVRDDVVDFSDCDDDEPAGEFISAHDTEEQAREAAAEIAHERGTCGAFVARDDVSDDYSMGGEYCVYID